ncbi:MAG: hypothetical protein J7L47_10660, partial [Candidatus Odinarchaeota archaeon]|nr:hypothetical protein [Candidatus Odinarchaeota archaeon]
DILCRPLTPKDLKNNAVKKILEYLKEIYPKEVYEINKKLLEKALKDFKNNPTDAKKENTLRRYLIQTFAMALASYKKLPKKLKQWYKMYGNRVSPSAAFLYFVTRDYLGKSDVFSDNKVPLIFEVDVNKTLELYKKNKTFFFTYVNKQFLDTVNKEVKEINELINIIKSKK